MKIGHIRITDHLILGVTKSFIDKGQETLQYSHLETVPMVSWNQVSDSICNGEVDGAFMLAPMAMDLFKSGEKVKLILLGHKNGSILIKNKKANINSYDDFKGKMVIIPYQLSIHNMLFHKILTEHGLEAGPAKEVSLEVFAPAQIPEAIRLDEFGEIGGFIVAEPFGSQVVKAGLGEELALSKDIWPNHPCCVLVMRDEAINKHEDAVYELVESLVKSGKFIENNSDDAAKIGAEFLNQQVDVIKRVLTEPKDRITTHELLPNLEDLDKIQKYMSQEMTAVKGLIDVEKFVDTKYALQAGAV
jgi:NitT/TauT family transport system substrate-binding protein